MKSFENTVSRYRKLDEMINELKEYVNALTAEREKLNAEIVIETLNKPRLFNAFQRKTSSAGIIGRNLFTVTFSDKLCRTEDKARLDDQEWLRNAVSDEYYSCKLELLASKVKADIKSGRLDKAKLKKMGLTVCKVGNLKVSRIPSDAEFPAIKAEASRLAETVED